MSYVSGKTWREFQEDVQFQDAVIRRIKIIGEATIRILEETHRSLPQIYWSDLVGILNDVIQDYDRVNLTKVWDTVHNDLPPLIAELEKIVPPEESE
ncbi:MAG: DUF86 domain-containing protein [Hormoscilla sp. GM102CHS1]|nr:DUF86 domain-containing protein [Hormoscilla sp. GM102CHS1]